MVWRRTLGIVLAALFFTGCGWWSQRTTGTAPKEKLSEETASSAMPVEEAASADRASEETRSKAVDARAATSGNPLPVEAETPKQPSAPKTAAPVKAKEAARAKAPAAKPAQPASQRAAVPVPPEIPAAAEAVPAGETSPAAAFDTAEASLPPAPSRQGIVVPPGPPRPGGGIAQSPPPGSGSDNRNVQAREPLRLAEGTVLEVRLTQGLGTRTHRAGDHFRAILDRDLEAEGGTVIPKGTEVEGTVLEALEAGRVKGRASLTFALTALLVGDEPVSIETNPITMEAESTKGDDLKKVGIGAAVGTALGAIFGGKKGAAVGGASGAGAGTAGVLLSRGKDVEIEKERLFSFRLEKEAVQEPR